MESETAIMSIRTRASTLEDETLDVIIMSDDEDVDGESYYDEDESDSYEDAFASAGTDDGVSVTSGYTSSSYTYCDLSVIWEETSCDLHEDRSQRSLPKDSTTKTKRPTDIHICFSPDDRWGMDGDAAPVFPLKLVSPVGRRRCRSLDLDDDYSSDDDEEDDSSSDDSHSKFAETLEDLRRFKNDMDSIRSVSNSKSSSIYSRATCATESMSDEDEASSRESVLVPLIASLGHDKANVVEIPMDDDHFTHVSLISGENCNSLRSSSTHSASSCSSDGISLRDSWRANTDDRWIMKTTDKDVAGVVKRPITFHESRHLLSKFLQDKRASQPSFSQIHVKMLIRRRVEQFSGERRRRLFAKSKKGLQRNLERGCVRLASPLGREEDNRRHISERFDGSQRQRSFMEAQDRLKVWMEKVQPERPCLRRSSSVRVRSLASSPLPSRGIRKSQSFLVRRESIMEVPETQQNISSERRQHLKRRLQLEFYSGQSRRNSFRRAKNAVSHKLERVLLQRLPSEPVGSSSLDLDSTTKRGRSLRRSLRANERSREKTKERMVGLQRQKSYKESRQIFQKQGPFVAWSPRPSTLRPKSRKMVSKNVLLKNGLKAFDDLSQFR